MRIFLALFLLFPLVELYVLFLVGAELGAGLTLLLVILAGLLGVFLLRLAGVATAWRVRERLARGEMPEREMFDGLAMAVAGGLLLFPGFISDLLALLCLLPATRTLLLRKLRQKAEEQAARQRAFADRYQKGFGEVHGEPAARSNNSRPDLIEGEWERRDR